MACEAHASKLYIVQAFSLCFMLMHCCALQEDADVRGLGPSPLHALKTPLAGPATDSTPELPYKPAPWPGAGTSTTGAVEHTRMADTLCPLLGAPACHGDPTVQELPEVPFHSLWLCIGNTSFSSWHSAVGLLNLRSSARLAHHWRPARPQHKPMLASPAMQTCARLFLRMAASYAHPWTPALQQHRPMLASPASQTCARYFSSAAMSIRLPPPRQ